MIRKQIYIQRQQQTILKRLSQIRGLSEAELIRQAIDRQISGIVSSPVPDPTAWDEARQFMLALRSRGPLANRPRDWSREDLYEERTGRHAGRVN
jgi:hypothetical protein